MSWINQVVQTEPWLAVSDAEVQRPGRIQDVTDELRKEIKPGHPLAQESWRVVALSNTRWDDVLLELDGCRAAAVHLTWNPDDQPPLPTCAVVSSVEELRYEWLD